MKHTAARASDPVSSGTPLTAMLRSWRLALDAARKSPKTIRSYLDSVRALSRYLAEHGMTNDVESTGAPEIRAFLATEIQRTSAASAQVHYRNLRVYFGWLVREGERESPNPLESVDKPKADQQVKPFLSDEDLAALFKVCDGQDFESRRDRAILSILLDCGVRVTGLANLRWHVEDDSRSDVYPTERRFVRSDPKKHHVLPEPGFGQKGATL